MTALSPTTPKIAKPFIWYADTRDQARRNMRSYEWGSEFSAFFWKRTICLIVALVLPVSLLAISPWVLMGYLWIAMLPVGSTLIAKNSSSEYADIEAHAVFTKLKDGWAEHGKVLYGQIWEHDCGRKRKVEYSYTYGDRRDDRIIFCEDCDVRLKELNALLDSQKSVERSIRSETSDLAIESSQEFRKAIKEQYTASDVMKQISNSAKVKGIR